jgi:PilZ domain
MSPVSESVARMRSERRIAVRLPLRVSGRDARGFSFEEETASENLCRSGAAFRTRFDVAIGSNLEIRIPVQGQSPRRTGQDFETQGKVVHISESLTDGEKVVGVQFVGPRFQRMFRSESMY